MQLINEIQKSDADVDQPNVWSSTRFVNERFATLFQCAQTLIEIGSHALALELLEPIESEIGGEEPSPWLHASTLQGLKITKAQAHAGLRQVDTALDLLEQARAIHQDWTVDNTETLFSIDSNVVAALIYGERWVEAIEKAENVLRSELGKDEPVPSNIRLTQLNLSIALAHTDRASEALEIQERLLADVMAHADHLAMEEFRLKSLIGETHFLLGKFPEALNFQQPVRDFFIKKLGATHPLSIEAEKDLNLTLQQGGESDQTPQPPLAPTSPVEKTRQF
jgi:tetratricopeptide (TPR) repeat protein